MLGLGRQAMYLGDNNLIDDIKNGKDENIVSEYARLYQNGEKPNIIDNIITLNVDPCPKPRMTRSDRWKQRPVVARYWKFKDDINRLFTGQLTPIVNVNFYLSMPKSWSNKKKLMMDGKPHQQKPDVDNLIKSLFDSLLEDDSFIYRVNAGKYWASKGYIEIVLEKEYNSGQKEIFTNGDF